MQILKLTPFNMKTIKYFIICAVIIIFTTGFLIADMAFAQKVLYPVEELGGCNDQDVCRAYCDKPANQEDCLNFAKENGLMSEEEVRKAKNFIEAGQAGPGGCQGKEECEQYCNNIEHIDQCISYAEKENLMSEEELQEAKKVQAAIKRGVKPPPCKNKDECDVYCEDADHMEECIAFGIEAGFIQGQELEDSQKMLAAIKRGVKPPPCKGKQACDEYCNNPDNMELCMNFAIEAGFMSEEEKVGAQGMLRALKMGIKPPPCKGREECDVYCRAEEHIEECINFSVAAGMMSEKDAEMARKTKGKGPGGCMGKEECDAFCNNPDNQQTCFEFGRDNGMIPEEELRKMEEGQAQMKQTFSQMPAEVETCLTGIIGAEMVEKMKNGFMPPQDIGQKMGECFRQMAPPEGSMPGEGGMMSPQGQTGPGGCQTAEECQSYCQSNPDQCNPPAGGFGPPSNQIMQPPQPCSGENCQYMPPQNQMMQGQPCSGEGCQSGPLPGQNIMPEQPRQELQPGQNIQPPSSGPEGGGSLIPGSEPVPLAPPSEQQSQQPAPSEAPPPPPPSSYLNPETFLGSVLYIIARALYSLR